MVVGVGGIGGMRDLGDPYDPRRGTSVPQQRPVPGAPSPQELFAELSASMPGVGRRPGMDQTADVLEARRAAISADPAVIEGRVAPSQAPTAAPTNTSYIDRSFGISRGYGAGGGGQVTPPLSASRGGHNILDLEDGTREIVTPSKGRRVVSSQIGISRSNPNAGAPAYVKSEQATPSQWPELPPEVTRPGESSLEKVDSAKAALAAEFSKLGIPLDESDAALLAEYANGNRPSELVEDTKVVQTQSRKKPSGFGNLSASEIDPKYSGYRPVPNSTGSEISPYYTVQVPNRGASGQLEGTVRIDPSAAQSTVTADSETVKNALHFGEDEVTTSNANFASELKQSNRTPLISTDTFNEALASGRLVQIQPNGAHVANLLNDDGSTTPVFSTRIRDKSETAAPMYRVGAPTNINYDDARDQANPQYKERSSQFDTQVVTADGRRTETGPVPFLNREDVYSKVSGLRRNVERGASTAPARRGEPVKTDHLPDAVQAGIAEAMAPRPTGGTRRERIDHDTASSFVKTGRSGKPYIETSGLANPLRGQEQSIVALDQVLNELASAGYMADPDVANGNQRLAAMVLKGDLTMDAIPARARDEVAREIDMLQAAARPTERVPVQSSPQISDAPVIDRAAQVAAEVRGDERNFAGDGSVVQGSYGDFGGEKDDNGRSTAGFSVKSAPDLAYSPEFAAAKTAVDEMYGFSNRMDGTISAANQQALNELAGQVLADAAAATPTPFIAADNKQFQAQLRQSAAQLGGAEVDVLQGRSAPIRTPNEVAVIEEGSQIPQNTQRGVVNTESVSQLNAPSSPTTVDVDPEIARLQPFVGNGVRQSQVDLISKGLAAEPGSATRSAADQLLSLFRKRFR